MNQMPNAYMMNPYMPNKWMNQAPINENMNSIMELEQRVNRLERQVKRLENKLLSQKELTQNDYSVFPPKDSGMYMM